MKKWINWFVSTISVVVGFLNGHAGDIYDEHDRLQFNDHNHQISISLIGWDQQITLKAAERTNQNIREALKS